MPTTALALPDAPAAASLPLPAVITPVCRRPRLDWAQAPLYVVLNARSGQHGGAPPLCERLNARLRAEGRRFRLLQANHPRELQGLARVAVNDAVSDGGIVVAAGGDGTINTVVQALWRQQVPFGVLPQGTFNFFGRSHGVSQETEAGIDTLLAGLAQQHLKPVQIGLVNDQVFLVNASLGLYPELLEDRERMKRRYGRSRAVAWLAGALTLMRPHRPLQIQLQQTDADGRSSEEHRRIATLFVGNNPLQLEQVGLDEAEAVRRGHLAALTLAPMGPLALARLAARGWLGKLGATDEVNNFAFSQLQIGRMGRRGRRAAATPGAAEPRGGRVKVAFDGESARLHTPLHFRVAPLPLWLVVPPGLPAIP
ncbi:MAG TPA: diacylglycerol kinase family protein [Ideonella sp.]|nr:diacylglycerol kinase family protein [Ideonella sp.]